MKRGRKPGGEIGKAEHCGALRSEEVLMRKARRGAANGRMANIFARICIPDEGKQSGGEARLRWRSGAKRLLCSLPWKKEPAPKVGMNTPDIVLKQRRQRIPRPSSPSSCGVFPERCRATTKE